MPNLSPLINIDALNDIYEIIKDRVINERVYRTDANPDEILGSESLPYTQAYIQNLNITDGGIVSGPSWSIASNGTISVPNGYTIHSNGNLSGIGSLTADDWNVTGDGQAHFNKTIDTDENISAGGNLSITGTTSLTGAVDASNTLNVSGLATFETSARVNNSISNDGNANSSSSWYIETLTTGSWRSEGKIDHLISTQINSDNISAGSLNVTGSISIDPGAEQGITTPFIRDTDRNAGGGIDASAPHFYINTDGSAEFKGIIGYNVIHTDGTTLPETSSGSRPGYAEGSWYIESEKGSAHFTDLYSSNATLRTATINGRIGNSNWNIQANGNIKVNNIQMNGKGASGCLSDTGSIGDNNWSINNQTGNAKFQSIEVSNVIGSAPSGGKTGNWWIDSSNGEAYFSSFSLDSITTGHIDADSITVTPGSITGNLNGTASIARLIEVDGISTSSEYAYLLGAGTEYSLGADNYKIYGTSAATVRGDGILEATGYIGPLYNVASSTSANTYLIGTTTSSSTGSAPVSRVSGVYVSSSNNVHATTFTGNLVGTAEKASTITVTNPGPTDDVTRPILLASSTGTGISAYAFSGFAYSPNASGIGTLYIKPSATGQASAVRGYMANNDWWWICGNQTYPDSGYLEIATFDNGNEPIYVRQRTSESTISKEITLMDASGNTTLRGLTVAGNVSLTGNISANQFRATDGFYVDSAEEYKENIKQTELNAINLLNKVNVVDFNYKSDKDKKKKIGFIADYTDELLATPEHNRMDTSNCIGVLIKAVQELSDRIERLENR